MSDYRLISMQLVHTIFQTCKQQHHFQLHFNIACDACNIITDIAPVQPPAKNIKPISSDAAAKSDRPGSIFASWQAVQDSVDVPPINGLWVPLSQKVQNVPPVEGLNVPDGHGIQDDDEVLPLYGLYVPAGHAMHDDNEVMPVDGL
jgi:hypothetical protein